MSRNTKPAKPLKGRNVSAVYLYVPPEVKNIWYNHYENVFRIIDKKPSISEFLSGIINQSITENIESGNILLTISCAGQDIALWNKLRLDESSDPEEPQTWDEFITSKVNSGINLFDEIQLSSPETGKLENEIIAIKEENIDLLQKVANLKDQLKRKDTMDHRMILKDSIIKIVAAANKPLRYVDVRQELNDRGIAYNKDAVYPALTDLVADDIIKMDLKGNSEFFSKL